MCTRSPLHTSYLLSFFTRTATTQIYTLSLHDALPISPDWRAIDRFQPYAAQRPVAGPRAGAARPGHGGRHRGRAVHGAAGPVGGVGWRCGACVASWAGPVVARCHGRTGAAALAAAVARGGQPPPVCARCAACAGVGRCG